MKKIFILGALFIALASFKTSDTYPCHPLGDLGPCTHWAHPLGDLGPCTHTYYDGYGNIHWMHPAGDLYSCQHWLHSAGDLYPCIHYCPF
jgi:hypothetical protein